MAARKSAQLTTPAHGRPREHLFSARARSVRISGPRAVALERRPALRDSGEAPRSCAEAPRSCAEARGDCGPAPRSCAEAPHLVVGGKHPSFAAKQSSFAEKHPTSAANFPLFVAKTVIFSADEASFPAAHPSNSGFDGSFFEAGPSAEAHALRGNAAQDAGKGVCRAGKAKKGGANAARG